MGIIAKQKTKRRVEPISAIAAIPTNKDAPWLTHGKIIAAAVVRATALSFDLRKMQSAAMRNELVSAFYSVVTSMRVETIGTSSWAVTLGPDSQPEWRCDIRIAADDTLRISTPRYLMNHEGVLVNGEMHDEFRRRILEALSTGSEVQGKAESDISLRSLDFSLVVDTVEALGRVEDEFVVTTERSAEELTNTINIFGLPRLPSESGSSCWGLGLSDLWSENHIKTTIIDEGARRVLRARISLGNSGSRFEQLLAARTASRTVAGLKGLAAGWPETTFTAPRTLPFD